MLTRRMELPARTQAQAQAAAALLLADVMASDRTQSHLALGPADAQDARWACALDRAAMEALLAQCAALGIDPDALAPDHLLAPEPRDPEGACAIRSEGRLAVRAQGFALTCEEELAPVILGERPVEVLEAADGAELEAALAAAAFAPPINLRQGAFAKRRSGRGLDGAQRRMFAAALAAAALLALAAPGLDAFRRNALAERLERQARTELQRTAPTLATARDPMAALRRASADGVGAPAGPAFSGAAAALFTALEAAPAAQLTALVFTSEGGLQVSLRTPRYEDVEALRQSLAGAGLRLDEGGSVTAPEGVVTELTVRPAA